MADIWVESEVFGETTAGNVLKEKLWNRVLRAYKISCKALWRVLWPLLIKWTQENGDVVVKTLEDLSAKLVTEFTPGEDNPAIDKTVYTYLINETGQACSHYRMFHIF